MPDLPVSAEADATPGTTPPPGADTNALLAVGHGVDLPAVEAAGGSYAAAAANAERIAMEHSERMAQQEGNAVS